MDLQRNMKEQLGIRRLLLQIHDASFPSQANEDTGRGSPYSQGGRELLAFVQSLGFDGIQSGPKGRLSRGNPCPYDSRIFPHDFLSVSLTPLARGDYWQGLLSEATLARVVESVPPGSSSTHHQHAWDEVSAALDEVYLCFRAGIQSGSELDRDLAAFRAANSDWLNSGRPDQPVTREELEQFILHKQHQELRRDFRGMRFYGDLQIGMAPEDARVFSTLFHPDYCMGAPPSRTNPEGQPWGYGVFHPEKVKSGEAAAFLSKRIGRLLSGFDGLRIDHPHGLVCPWVYRRAADDVSVAVREGARLYESPASQDHPELAAYAIARDEQLDRSQAPFDERWVRELDEAQVQQYSALIDVVVETIRDSGGDVASDLACEVLSTWPYPLQRVLERHELGRFRIVQKADLGNPNDVYRIEQAGPRDWIMLGNHDTPSIWLLARGWCNGGRAQEWGEYLAERLWLSGTARSDFVRRVSSSPGELVHGIFSAMLASRAAHVSVFFVDLLGLTGFFNRPGVVNETNWRLRVPRDYQESYQQRCRTGEALDLERCFLAAVEARARTRASHLESQH